MKKAPTISDCVFSIQNATIIDTHVHYNLNPLFSNWQTHWQKAQSKEVTASVVASIDLISSQKAVEIANQDDNLWALVGVHPSEVAKNKSLDQVVTELSRLLDDPKVLGIGEIGLDYYWLSDSQLAKKSQVQQIWFQAQLELVRQKGGWISLHIRDKAEPVEQTKGNAYWDAYQIMKQYDWSNQPFILHCVSGSNTYVKAMLELGAYIGFDGNITYPSATNLRSLLDLVPADRLLVETDAPYLPPQSQRGKPCEPWMIAETASYLQSYFQARNQLE